MTAPATRLRVSLLLAALFAGGLIAAACQPTDTATYTPPVGTTYDLRGAQ